jgi:hypothetical protein
LGKMYQETGDYLALWMVASALILQR